MVLHYGSCSGFRATCMNAVFARWRAARGCRGSTYAKQLQLNFQLGHHPWNGAVRRRHAGYWPTESSGSIRRSCFEEWISGFFAIEKTGFASARPPSFKRRTHAHSLRGKNRRVQRNAQTQRYARRGQKRAQRGHKAVSGDPPNKSARAQIKRRARTPPPRVEPCPSSNTMGPP